MSRISTFSDAETVEDFLNSQPDIDQDEIISAVIALSRHVVKLEGQIEKLERQITESA